MFISTNRVRISVLAMLMVSTSLASAKCVHNNDIPELPQPDPSIPPPVTVTSTTRDIVIWPCTWVIDRKCPDDDIKFYLFTRRNIQDRQNLLIDDSLEKSNLTDSNFDPRNPTKIVIHGYNSDMFLHPLILMKDEYLQVGDYNMIYVDWSILSPGPCYMSAVHNTRHAGACVAQLVERILDSGSADIHIIGFSLGAQMTNFVARNLGSFLLPRITGLDPAMPLFVTSNIDDKLDSSDAVFVDVFHTNALVQGKLERCGHVDFYMNGGIIQPGCNGNGINPFACSHQRAPAYFMESIRSYNGFWGWACSSYIYYLLGMCPQTNFLVEAGEKTSPKAHGMYLVETADQSPFALGKWTGLPNISGSSNIVRPQPQLVLQPVKRYDPLMKELDNWGKLDSHFNNIDPQSTSNSPDSNDEWSMFGPIGPSVTINNEVKYDSVEENDEDSSIFLKTRRRRPGNSKFRRKPQIDLFRRGDETVKDSWNDFKRNLTAGFVDRHIFQLPKIRTNSYRS